MASAELDFADRDERLGEAVEEYLALAESGSAPDVEEFAGRYPDLSGDLREALEGLSLVRGLVGQPAISTGPKLEAGRRLAGYRIVGELGSGGMGVVYEAVHVDLDRPVALKVLDARATRDGNGLRRFLNEAKTAAALHHTHIVPVFDVGHVGGLCYYAMQRIEGCGLDRLVKSLRRERTSGAGSGSGRRSWTWKRSHLIRANPDTEPDLSGLVSGATLSWAAEKRRWHRDAVALNSQQAPFEPPRGSAYYRWVAEIGRQAAQALAYAHRRGVIHRDIKPSNLLVDVRGVVWVADFGLARRLTDPGLTHSDSVIGTPRYMSPEQTRSGPVDGRSDVYSLGATLYELLTLRPPFEGRTTAELFEQISRDEPIQPRRLDPFVPRDLETIVLKALSKRPGDRYSDPTELAEDLERFLNLEPVRARRIGPLGRAWRFAQRHPALTGVTLGAATVILAVTTIAYDRVVHERDRAIQAELKYKDAHREGLLNEAILLRNSWETDRREKGFAKLAEAARLDPDPDEQTKLQTEAIAFLSLRDVEQRKTLKIDRSTGLAFNSDGTRLATVSADRTMVTFWSVESGRQLGQPQPAGPSNGTLREQDGPWNLGLRGSSRIAAAGPCVVTIWPDGRGLRLLNFATGLSTADIRCLNREIYAVYAASTTDGLRIVTIDRTRGDGRRVCLWDPDRPEEPIATLAESRPGPTEPRQFPLIAVARGGDTIATAWSRGTTVALYSLQDGHMLGEELDTNMAVSALAMDAFNHLAVAGGGAVRLWDLTAPVPTSLPSITPHKNYIGAMRFSPDGSLLAVAGSGRDVELWDPAANTLVAALPTAEWVTDLSFAPAGSSFAVGQPAGVALWAVVDSPIVARASGFQASPTALAFGPDGRLAMAFRPAPTNEDVRLWQPEHCPTTARSLPGSGPALVAFDSEGHLNLFRGDRFDQFTIDGPSFNTSTPDRSLVLPEFLPHSWDRNRDRDHNHDRGAGNRPPPPRERSSPFSFQVPALGQTPDGRVIALSRWSQGANHLILWRPSDPDRLQTIIPPADQRRIGQAPWTQIALAPNATRLYLASIGPGPAGNPSGEFQVWSIVGDTATRLRWPYRYGRITALALSPDGTTLALGDRSGDLLLIDSATGSLQARLAPPHDGQPGVLTALAFSPRGDALAVGTKLGSVLVYHLKPGQPEPKAPLRLTDHRGQVLALAYDRTGTRLATSGQDNTVTVWSLDRLDRELARLGLAW